MRNKRLIGTKKLNFNKMGSVFSISRGALVMACVASSVSGFSLQGSGFLPRYSLLRPVSQLQPYKCTHFNQCPSFTSGPLHATPITSTITTADRSSEAGADVPPQQQEAQQAIRPAAVKSIPPKTFKKMFPLGAMLFFILFNYTILRDTKDVLVVIAPNSGAEIIPFLKTYVNFPSALGFAVLYSYLCNKFSSEQVFYILLSSFLAFFGAFAGIICEF